MNDLAAARYLSFSKIDRDSTEIHFGRLRPAAGDLPPQMRADSCSKLWQSERLGQVVVGTGVERCNLMLLPASRRQYDHRHSGPDAKFPNHVNAVHIR